MAGASESQEFRYEFALRLLLTDSCNLRCTFCHNEFQGDVVPGTERQDFRLEKLSQCSIEASEQGNRPIALKLSGGEPLLAGDHCVELLNWSTADPNIHRSILLSNLAVEMRASLLADAANAGLDEVRVNVPSVDPGEYGSITQCDESTASTRLRRVHKHMEILDGHGVEIQTNLVATADDLSDDFGRIREHLERLERSWPVSTVRMIVDDRSPQRQQILQGLQHLTTRASSRLSLLTAVCAEIHDDGRAHHDWYLVPPGVPLPGRKHGRAYRSKPVEIRQR